jgi:hypothetical protein
MDLDSGDARTPKLEHGPSWEKWSWQQVGKFRCRNRSTPGPVTVTIRISEILISQLPFQYTQYSDSNCWLVMSESAISVLFLAAHYAQIFSRRNSRNDSDRDTP